MEPNNYVLLKRTEYDISLVKELEDELSALAPGTATIDISNVLYMDTTAIRALIAIGKKIGGNRRDAVTLRGATPTMRRIFDVIALDQIFTIE